MSLRRPAFWVLAAAIPLLSSCAGITPPKGKISEGQVEITNEQYVIDVIGPNRYIDYRGVVKNWMEKDVFSVVVNYVGFDKAGKPTVNFKQKLAEKLPAGAEQKFEFRKSIVNTDFERFGSQITYLEKKTTFLDSITPAYLRES